MQNHGIETWDICELQKLVIYPVELTTLSWHLQPLSEPPVLDHQ